MKNAEIMVWLEYWDRARMVAVDKILSFENVNTARKYCQCMHVGLFHPDLVTDLQIWRALSESRLQVRTHAPGPPGAIERNSNGI